MLMQNVVLEFVKVVSAKQQMVSGTLYLRCLQYSMAKVEFASSMILHHRYNIKKM